MVRSSRLSVSGISCRIISRELSEAKVSNHFNQSCDRWFLDVQILSNRCHDKSVLYVTCDEDLVQSYGAEYAVVYVGDVADDVRGAIGVVDTQEPFGDIFSLLQDISLRYRGWERDMDSSLLREEGLQTLLDLASAFIPNHIDIVDPAMKLLAHSDDSDLDDPITNRLVKLGYHSEDTIEQFRLDKRFKLWSESEGLIVNTERKISRFPSILYCFKTTGSFSVIVVMICNVMEPCGYLKDVYRLVVSRIAHYVRREYEGFTTASEAICTFIRDLSHGVITTEREIKERARFVDILYVGPYCLFYFGLENVRDIPVWRFVAEISERSVPAITVKLDNCLLVLCSNCRDSACKGLCREGCPRRRKNIKQRLSQVAQSYGRHGSCSAVMGSLADLPIAYEQARMAYEMHSRELTMGTVSACESPLVSFDSFFLYSYLANQLLVDGGMLASSRAFRVIDEMNRYDVQNGTDYYKFLECYLENDRKATRVAELCNMHRNNVPKRLERIEELFGAQTETFEQRLSLMLVFEVRRHMLS